MVRKYLPLVWGSLFRKKTRTGFTLASLTAAFLLLGLLQRLLGLLGRGLRHVDLLVDRSHPRQRAPWCPRA